MSPRWAKTLQHTVLSNSLSTSEGVHALTPPGTTCGATPEICGFTGLSEIQELNYTMPGAMPSTVVTLAGAMVLSRLCV